MPPVTNFIVRGKPILSAVIRKFRGNLTGPNTAAAMRALPKRACELLAGKRLANLSIHLCMADSLASRNLQTNFHPLRALYSIDLLIECSCWLRCLLKFCYSDFDSSSSISTVTKILPKKILKCLCSENFLHVPLQSLNLNDIADKPFCCTSTAA